MRILKIVQAYYPFQEKGGLARRDGAITGALPLRDPEETLSYHSLLQVCGSASNAFINLALSSGLHARRLLPLNSKGSTTHVDAQVLLDGRRVVIDTAFRIILRGPDGTPSCLAITFLLGLGCRRRLARNTGQCQRP